MAIVPTYPITGIRAGLDFADHVPLRLEIDAWFGSIKPTEKLQVQLFILALKHFQEMDPADKLSYFQVAGVHGQPFVAWDEHTKPETPNEGYCTHANVLFPCWHRPYVLLYEQRIHEIMTQVIIPKYPRHRQEQLIGAANTWRLPYWDWAVMKSDASRRFNYNVPKIVRMKKIWVEGPEGPVKIDNPMYRFSMPGGKSMGEYGITPIDEIPFDQCVGTSRCASYPLNPSLCISGVGNHDQIADNLHRHNWNKGKADGSVLSESVYRLFSKEYFSKYETFATTQYEPEQRLTEYLSCEGVHNNIHDWIGGFGTFAGHMTFPPVSAFDPIFWIHHCNVDRQFATWQTLNPTTWFTEKDKFSGKAKSDTFDTQKTPLTPFHSDDQGGLYNSNMIRDWTKLGYTYPELQPWLLEYKPLGVFDRRRYIKAVKRHINKLYGSTRRLVLMPPLSKIEALENDYIVNVVYERFALKGLPFTVHIFIGFTEKGEAYFRNAPSTRVGSVYNFSAPSRTGKRSCANCERQEKSGAKSTGQVPITHALLRHIIDDSKPLDSLHRPQVERYLTANLHWSITTIGGRNVPLDSMPSLRVSVAVGTAVHHEDPDTLSQYSDYEPLDFSPSGQPSASTHQQPASARTYHDLPAYPDLSSLSTIANPTTFSIRCR
ncbi:hypothetical protein MMC07_007400 [Pseudocyphellaria aurata]|nr:hypothetical protein [Pseudocyphellaria aurata]